MTLYYLMWTTLDSLKHTSTCKIKTQKSQYVLKLRVCESTDDDTYQISDVKIFVKHSCHKDSTNSLKTIVGEIQFLYASIFLKVTNKQNIDLQ